MTKQKTSKKKLRPKKYAKKLSLYPLSLEKVLEAVLTGGRPKNVKPSRGLAKA